MSWGKTDTANDCPIWVTNLLNVAPNTTNRNAIFGNTTANAFIGGTTTGVFAAAADEVKNRGGAVSHTGWVKRMVGTGGRAGRIQTEVLIAGGITGDSDVTFTNIVLTITLQPASKSVNTGLATTFSTNATASDANAVIAYSWKGNAGGGWVTLTDSGVYSNTTTKTLSIANVAGLDTVQYQAVASSNNAANAFSAIATLTVV